MTWHWAHIGGQSCDPWAEAETPWHRWWKNRVPRDRQEVVIGDHRADIRIDRGVIELQHSSISPEEIRERESHYRQMIWLLDGRRMTLESLQFGFPVNRIEPWPVRLAGGTSVTGLMEWEWRWPKNSFLAASKRVCIDLCEQVLEVHELRRDRGKTFLRGRLRTREGFMGS